MKRLLFAAAILGAIWAQNPTSHCSRTYVTPDVYVCYHGAA